MSKGSNITYISLIALLSVAILLLMLINIRYPREVVKEVHTTDTLVVHKTDSILVEKPVYIDREVRDTIIVEKEGESLPLVFQTIHYGEPNLYDVYVEGYNPILKSIMVYPKTEYRVVTNTVEKEVLVKRWNVYAGLELGYINKSFFPKIGIYTTSPNKWLFGANLGYYDRNVYVGGTIAYKLNR